MLSRSRRSRTNSPAPAQHHHHHYDASLHPRDAATGRFTRSRSRDAMSGNDNDDYGHQNHHDDLHDDVSTVAVSRPYRVPRGRQGISSRSPSPPAAAAATIRSPFGKLRSRANITDAKKKATAARSSSRTSAPHHNIPHHRHHGHHHHHDDGNDDDAVRVGHKDDKETEEHVPNVARQRLRTAPKSSSVGSASRHDHNHLRTLNDVSSFVFNSAYAVDPSHPTPLDSPYRLPPPVGHQKGLLKSRRRHEGGHHDSGEVSVGEFLYHSNTHNSGHDDDHYQHWSMPPSPRTLARRLGNDDYYRRQRLEADDHLIRNILILLGMFGLGIAYLMGSVIPK